ncbi:MAG: HXXEE domain-containing protein [Bacteroidales bacterium]|nr:HXXEE domain-containing protein [Bacteroidales bacterium]
MKVFRFYCRYWAVIGGVLFVLLAFVVGLIQDSVPTTQRLMVLLYMALLFHQFEEYVFPGGFPAACNRGLFGEKKELNRYPLNELSATIVNTFLAYTLYLFGIFCYNCLWLGIFIAYFTMSQVFMHCLKLNISLKAWYSPGCFSALFVMLPMGVYYLCYVATHFVVPHYYWWGPIVAFPLAAVVMILLPILICRSRKTTFGFAPYQTEEFEVRHGIATLFQK